MLGYRAFCIALITLYCSAPLHAAEAPDDSGAALYQALCASCHGKQARGDGPVAQSLNVKPADLTRLAQRNNGQFPTVAVTQFIDGRTLIASHGVRDMPIWGQELYGYDGMDPARQARVAELIQRLVTYLRSIQR